MGSRGRGILVQDFGRSPLGFRFTKMNPFVTCPGPPNPSPVAVKRPRRSGSLSKMASIARM